MTRDGAFEENRASQRVMAKCGMRFEGTQRQASFNNQGICDLSWYGILASDKEKNL